MAATPAQILRQRLIDLGLVTHPDSNLAWPCYVASLHDDKDNAVQIRNVGGSLEGEILGTGEAIVKPGLMLVIRGLTQAVAYNKADQLWDALGSSIKGSSVTVASTEYDLMGFNRTTTILDDGEEVGKRRWLFSIKGRLAVKP